MHQISLLIHDDPCRKLEVALVGVLLNSQTMAIGPCVTCKWAPHNP